jgi:hypothetical protein
MIAKATMLLCIGGATALNTLAARPTMTRSGAPRMEGPPPGAVKLAEDLNPAIGYFDPLGLATANFWEKGNDFTYGWIRQAEIKHGRVAMAAFVGYLVQSSGAHWAFPLQGGDVAYGSLAYTPGLSPPEQWDALPIEARWQIILFIGFLEWWSEFAPEVHYTKPEGKPGYFPPFDDRKGENRIGNGFGWPNPFPLPSLYQPFGPAQFFPNPLKGEVGSKVPEPTEEEKARGRLVEINNGRLAMIGIMGFLAESKVPGSVPFLVGKIKPYAGEVMSPFEPVTVAAAAAEFAQAASDAGSAVVGAAASAL